MKLYFSPGSCSLSPHIVLREAGFSFDLEQVNNQEKKTRSGEDYWGINAKGQVPVLELDDGERITQGPVIVQYLADKKPSSRLIPMPGTMERVRVQEWLNFITSELHKGYAPLFRPTTPDAYRDIIKETLGKRFDWLDQHFAAHEFLTGDGFTVADAYMFTILRWSDRLKIDMSKWTNIRAFMDRVAARPKVREALTAEGLIKAA
jgi:glutathione S-transferase